MGEAFILFLCLYSPVNQLVSVFLKFILCLEIYRTNSCALLNFFGVPSTALFYTLIPKYQVEFPKKYVIDETDTTLHHQWRRDCYRSIFSQLFYIFLYVFIHVIKFVPCNYFVHSKMSLIPLCIAEVALF